MNNYWVSWCTYEKDGCFQLSSPWWVTGYTSDDAETVCAAIKAVDESEAKEIIYGSYSVRPSELIFRFIESRDADWSPFGMRFRRQDWMEW